MREREGGGKKERAGKEMSINLKIKIEIIYFISILFLKRVSNY